jgi:hypothetical protein
MKKIRKSGKTVSAEKISRLAEHGEDVSRFFTNLGGMAGSVKSAQETGE